MTLQQEQNDPGDAVVGHQKNGVGVRQGDTVDALRHQVVTGGVDQVFVSIGKTINLGEGTYESLRIDVGRVRSCTPETVEDVKLEVANEVLELYIGLRDQVMSLINEGTV
jgi:hypothetical protein